VEASDVPTFSDEDDDEDKLSSGTATAAAVVVAPVPFSHGEASPPSDSPAVGAATFPSIPLLPPHQQDLVFGLLPKFARIITPDSPFVIVIEAFHVRSLNSAQVQALPFVPVKVIETLPLDSCVYFRGTVAELPKPIPSKPAAVTIVLQDHSGHKITVAVWPQKDVQSLVSSAVRGMSVSIHRVFVSFFADRAQLSVPFLFKRSPSYFTTRNPASLNLYERYGVEPGHLEVEHHMSERDSAPPARSTSSSHSSQSSSHRA
jgi:hypothetical protein